MMGTTVSDQVQSTLADPTLVKLQTLIRPHESAQVRLDKTRRLRTVELAGPSGQLEALLNEGAPEAKLAALLCHPHPLGGGNLHNKVVYHAMKALNDPRWGLALPVLRFNFRGVGLSQGKHDGQAELEDVLAGLAWLENAFSLPVVAVGFSFGAVMALKACCCMDRAHNLRTLVALGLPIEAQNRHYQYPFLKDILIPKLFLSGDGDLFAPAAQLRQAVASAADPKDLVFIPGADHFFTNRLEPMQKALSGWLKEQLV